MNTDSANEFTSVKKTQQQKINIKLQTLTCTFTTVYSVRTNKAVEQRPHYNTSSRGDTLTR